MISVERTREIETIKKIVRHPRVYGMVSDDFSPVADAWEPILSEQIIYLLAKDGDEVLGLFGFYPHNAVTFWVHTCLLPCAAGPKGLEAAQRAREWMWANTPCVRIVTEVPSYNTLALRFAERAGLTEFGYNPNSFQKNGQLFGATFLGISKGEKCQLQQL